MKNKITKRFTNRNKLMRFVVVLIVLLFVISAFSVMTYGNSMPNQNSSSSSQNSTQNSNSVVSSSQASSNYKILNPKTFDNDINTANSFATAEVDPSVNYSEETLLLNNSLLPGNVPNTGNGMYPTFLAYDSSNNTIYVANWGSNSVSVISGSTNQVIANVYVGSYVWGGVAYDSHDNYIYVANAGSKNVSVISGSTNQVIANVTVGSGPQGVAYDSSNNTIYVANEYSNNVSVINGSTNHVIATVTGFSNPYGVAYDPASNTIYVANAGLNSVSVIPCSGDTVTANVTVGSVPQGVAYDSHDNYIYVANAGSNTVSVISCSSNTVTATVTVGSTPIGVAYDNTSKTIYVANEYSNTVSVISCSSNTVTATVTVGSTPIGVAYDNTSKTIYVANEYSNTVSVISGSTNTVIANVTVGYYGPDAIAYDPSNNYIYVANYVSDNSDNVSVINGATNMVIGSIIVGSGPDAIAYDPSNNYIYVANAVSNNVSVINGTTNSVIVSISVGYWPDAIAYDPSNNYIYVANGNSSNVSVINGSTNKVIANVYVGSSVWGVAYDPASNTIYVTNTYPNTVSVISGSNNTIIAKVTVGYGPDGVAYDNTSKTIYVTITNTNNVSVINGATNSVTGSISVGSDPAVIAYDPSNNYIYVANYASNNVSVINGATNMVISSIIVGSGPDGVAYDSYDNYIYVANYFSGSITIIIPTIAKYTFTESGLPSYSSWYVNITNSITSVTASSGVILGSTSTYTIALINGTYSYTVQTGDKEYAPSPYTGSFTVNGASKSVSVMFVKQAHLSIIISPKNATLSINGKNETSANGNISLFPGTYFINASLSGFTSYSNRITLSAGQNYTINITLKQIPVYGYLVGTVIPINATVSVSGTIVPVTNGYFNISLPLGTYYVSVTAGGYNGNITKVTIFAREAASLTVTLTQTSSSITISGVVPRYASVTANGFIAYVNSTGYYFVSVPSGTVTISAYLSGYYPYSKTLSLSTSTIINITLVKEPTQTSTSVIPNSNVTAEGFNVSVTNITSEKSMISLNFSATVNGTITVSIPYSQMQNATISDILNSSVYVNGTLYQNFSITITSNYTIILMVYDLKGDPSLYWFYTPISTYTITFTESGLPSGTTWSVTLAGTSESSTTSTITFTEPNGTYSYSVGSITGYNTPSSGTVTVSGANVNVPITFSLVTYTTQYYLTMIASSSNGGTISPSSGWYNAGSSVTIQATANANFEFISWSGTGTGSYTGTNNSATVTMNAPITETANFIRIYAISFVETGLPSGTLWYVNLTNGQSFSSTTSTITFTEQNGTYSYSIATTNKEYQAQTGSFTVNGANVNIAVPFSLVTYTITFTENGLSSGIEWSVTLNGITHNSTTSKITFTEPNGTYSYTVITPISGGSGVQYVTTQSSGSLTVSGSNVTMNIAYTTQYYLTVIASPSNGGTVSPSSGWYNAGSSVTIQAIPNSNFEFESWPGTGDGSYSGINNPVIITMNGPITETANFIKLYQITFTENGLPSGTTWYVNLTNGQYFSSTTSTIVFTEQNGSYSYTVMTPISGGYGIQYITAQSSGSVTVNGANVTVNIAYTTQYYLTMIASPSNGGTISPSSGWYNAGSSVTIQATANTNFEFVSWSGTGDGSYSANSTMVTITVNGPITEKANFIELYQITLIEHGLSSGTSWSATLTGTTLNGQYINNILSSTTSTIVFTEPNGTYSYSVGSITGYTASHISGNMTVDGANVTTFSLVTYTATSNLIDFLPICVIGILVALYVFRKFSAKAPINNLDFIALQKFNRYINDQANLNSDFYSLSEKLESLPEFPFSKFADTIDKNIERESDKKLLAEKINKSINNISDPLTAEALKKYNLHSNREIEANEYLAALSDFGKTAGGFIEYTKHRKNEFSYFEGLTKTLTQQLEKLNRRRKFSLFRQ